MAFPKKIALEFWHHKERVAGKKGQQYIFRSKWFLLLLVVCAITLIPLALSTFVFYTTNKNETITDMLSETAVLARGASVDMEIFFDQYLTTLRVISSQYPINDLKNKEVLASILKNIGKTNIRFSSFSLINENCEIVACSCNNTNIGPNKILKKHLKTLKHNKDFFIGRILTEDKKIQFFVSLKLTQTNQKDIFITGIINNTTAASFLAKLKVRDVVDVFILDTHEVLMTPSKYFGQSGSVAKMPKLSTFPSSEVISIPGGNKDSSAFLFAGLSKIGNTDMRLGILMSNNSFKKFIDRIKFHIVIMVSLSILFISAVALLLVTYVVQVLYRADKVRQVYLKKAARSSKMASIGQLAAGVAHEINNPLAIINEKAGLLLDLFSLKKEYQDDARLSAAVESIIHAVKRAGTVTHRLLGFARETDISIQTLNIKETIHEVLGFVEKEAEYKSINIDINIPQPFPDIISDRGKLQQILINLISNAIAALDEKGTLTIAAKNNISNESIELYVEDNGCGISTDHQKKIFEPFFTTKTEIGGTGLGLALTYGLIRDMHGTLELESTPGIGTIFTITLPYIIKKMEAD